MRARLGRTTASVCLAASLAAGRARAQEPPPPPPEASPPPAAPTAAPSPPQHLAPPPYVPPVSSPEPTAGLGANLSVGFSFLTTPPDMTLTTPDGGAMKQFAGTPLTHLAGMEMVSLSISGFYRTASPFLLPLLGFEFGFPVSTGYPGSIDLRAKPALAWQRGGPTYYDGLDILGAGFDLGTGSFRFALAVLPGFRFVSTTGTITQGLLTIDAEASTLSFSLRADVSACLGAKAAASLCLFGTPHVYEFSKWMNGALFGLRLETN